MPALAEVLTPTKDRSSTEAGFGRDISRRPQCTRKWLARPSVHHERAIAAGEKQVHFYSLSEVGRFEPSDLLGVPSNLPLAEHHEINAKACKCAKPYIRMPVAIKMSHAIALSI